MTQSDHKQIKEHFERYVNLVMERFEERELRLVEAFDGRLELRLKPIEDLLRRHDDDNVAFKAVVKNHETRITKLEKKTA